MRRAGLIRLAWLVPLAVFLAVYLPTAGHGFVRDDFQWVAGARVASLADVLRIFHQDNGFYRPAVALTFVGDWWLVGVGPLGYGLTNVALALACAAAIACLGRRLGLPRGAAWLGAMLWLLNIHGLTMAVLWISGRTALVLTLAATMTAAAMVRGRIGAAAAWLGVALLAKEEAIVLPLTLAAWLVVLDRLQVGRRIRLGWWAAVSVAAEAAYFGLRASTHAMTLSTAPAFYRLDFDPLHVLRNAAEYADRCGTLAVVVVGLAWLLFGRPSWRLESRTRMLVVLGVIWACGGVAINVFLPARSDLYACLPSVGVALAAAAIVAEWWAASTEARRSLALVGAVISACLLGVVLYPRTARWVVPADFSTAALRDLNRLTSALPDDAVVLLTDDRRQPDNLASAFATGIDDAFTLMTGRRLRLWIEPPVETGAGDPTFVAPCADCASMRLAVIDGRLRVAMAR